MITFIGEGRSWLLSFLLVCNICNIRRGLSSLLHGCACSVTMTLPDYYYYSEMDLVPVGRFNRWAWGRLTSIT